MNVRGGGATTAEDSVAKLGISITVFGNVGVTLETARIRTPGVVADGPPMPSSAALASLTSTTAAPPSEVAQMSSRCSGSATTGESSTSSTVTSLRYRALGGWRGRGGRS